MDKKIKAIVEGVMVALKESGAVELMDELVKLPSIEGIMIDRKNYDFGEFANLTVYTIDEDGKKAHTLTRLNGEWELKTVSNIDDKKTG